MRIYFSGIGGVGIGPLAEIARDAGHEVVGSDRSASLITKELERSGVTVSFDQSGRFLEGKHNKKPIDWFCYTSALPHDHPELVLARKLGVRISKRDELLAAIISGADLKLIAVAGTHGKTTTTGLLVWAMKQLHIPVSYSIGTTLSWGPSGHFDQASEYFVYECDEFDRNFLHFNPYLSLITSVGYDHNDTYPTRDDYKQAFRQFINQSKDVLLWEADRQYLDTDSANQTVLNAHPSVKLPGEHNRRNAELVFKALQKINIASDDEIRRSLESFPGVARRFEKLADNLYSDYGHHPDEIKATLQMAKELSDKVALIYQPHQNTRQHEILDLYQDEIFKDGDKIYWLPTYLSRENNSLPILTPKEIAKNLHREINFPELDDILWQKTKQLVAEGYLVLFMGAGTIDSWARGQLTKTTI